jgi:hypothetical protein
LYPLDVALEVFALMSVRFWKNPALSPYPLDDAANAIVTHPRIRSPTIAVANAGMCALIFI